MSLFCYIAKCTCKPHIHTRVRARCHYSLFFCTVPPALQPARSAASMCIHSSPCTQHKPTHTSVLTRAVCVDSVRPSKLNG